MHTYHVELGPQNAACVDEREFDAWCAYCAARIEERSGVACTVEFLSYPNGGSDRIVGYGDDDRSAIRRAITDIWEEFCGDDAAWPEQSLP